MILRVVIVVLSLVAAAWPAAAERRLALVIGNSAYQHSSPLTNPANDASDVAAALRQVGFEVILGLDLDRRGLEGKVREFARALAGAETGLLFYAGHAIQVGRINYLLPIDAKLETERDLEFEAVRLELVLAQMEIAREGRTNIVLLDACRDNPLARGLARTMGTRSASLGRGLAQVQGGVGTFIAYSTQPDNVALDGQGRNSPFTSALARHMTTPGRSLSGVMIEVRKDVIAATKGQQVPWDHSALTGEFYFRAGTGQPDATRSPAEVAALTERTKALEAELKSRADAETIARLTVLRERRRELERQVADGRQRLFETQREVSRDSDPQKQRERQMAVLTAQRRLGEQQVRLRETGDEIAALELLSKEMPAVPKSGVQQAVTGSGAIANAAVEPRAKVRRFASYTPVRQDGEVDVYEKAKPHGELIDAGAGETFEACLRACRAEPTCLAFATEARTGMCETYKTIDGLRQDAGWSAGVRNR